MATEQEERRNREYIRDALYIAHDLVQLITNYENPCDDFVVQELREGDDRYRKYPPVCLFAAIQFVDELAQIIQPKRVAEMPAPEAWIWEMRRVIELANDQLFLFHSNENKLIQAMVERINQIVDEERRVYEHS